MATTKRSDQAAAFSPALTGAVDGSAVSLVHNVLRAREVSCATIGSAFLERLGVSVTAPLAQALLKICADADQSGRANAYHNPAHSREVGVNWFCLAFLHNALSGHSSGFGLLGASDIVVGLCAAFGHDLDHDGRGNTENGGFYRPFWLEARAAEQVASWMEAAGASAEEVAGVRCAILLTDPLSGYPMLEASLKPSFDIEQAVSVRPEFAHLADPAVRLISAMLRDADLMPSAAMAAHDLDARTREMLIEQGRDGAAPDRASTDAFLSGLVGGLFLSPPGARFQGDLDHLKTLNAARGHRPGSLAPGEPAGGDDSTNATAAALISALGLDMVISEASPQPISS
jgi:hypothetical protein